MTLAWDRPLTADGFFLATGVFSPSHVECALNELTTALAQDRAGSALRSGTGNLYGARNVLQLWPAAADVWKQPPLPNMLREVLGSRFGLVRVLFFDKPPDSSWGLPWHKDMAIAVRDNRLPSARFAKPTRKAGVPHVEAPLDVLENMLTLRLHLDNVTEENGPLRVIPGSHQSGDDRAPVTILAERGDVLLMRPLLSHASNRSHAGTARHRRILHLEFAGSPELGDGYAWHTFIPGAP
jgi:Phytanoyl-CoA dioxygenase (PhyH)